MTEQLEIPLPPCATPDNVQLIQEYKALERRLAGAVKRKVNSEWTRESLSATPKECQVYEKACRDIEKIKQALTETQRQAAKLEW